MTVTEASASSDASKQSTPKIESNSPFFLGPQDRPGDFITPTRLRGDNYDDWAGDIQTALEARRKFGFLDGTITAPVPPCTTSDWLTINAMLVSWIMNTIDPEVKCYLSKYRDAKRLWDTLKSRYAIVNGPRIQQLKASIAKCEQTKSMPVAEYFGKLTALWEELHNHEPIIDCACCTNCTAGAQHETRRNTDMLHKFLMGLYSDYFSTLRTNILSQDPLPSLDKAFQLVVQDERVRTSKVVQEEKLAEVLGFAVKVGKGRGRGDKPDKSHLNCTHCKKSGHEVGSCFELVGYPEWWEQNNRTDVGVRGGRSGGRGRGTVRANNVSTGGGVAGKDNNSPLLFTAEQWKALTGLMSTSMIPDERLNGEFQKRLWIIDSGATHHVTGDASWLHNARDILGRLGGLPDGKRVVGTREGCVKLSNKITLKRVLFVPKLSCNLISVSQLNDDMQCITQFDSSICAIQDRSRKLIGAGIRRDRLYYFGKGGSILHVSVDAAVSTLELWHKRMGHPSEKVVKSLPPVCNLRGHINKAREVCFRAKQSRDKFCLSDNKTSRIFEKIHCDLWGPYKHLSSCGTRYFLTIVDDFSRGVWVYLLTDKTEVFEMFMSFVAMVGRQFSKNINIVQSDNGTEFNCLFPYFSKHGILFQTSCVGTPQQNGRVERKHKHILNVARALMFQAKMPISFWGESILTAVHLINRTPSLLLDNKSPFEILFGTLPSYTTLKVFGCLCFAHNQKSKGDKFASRSRKCVFVGYPFGKKGWKLFDLENNEYFVSRDVKFFEDIYPYSDMNFTSRDTLHASPTEPAYFDEFVEDTGPKDG